MNPDLLTREALKASYFQVMFANIPFRTHRGPQKITVLTR